MSKFPVRVFIDELLFFIKETDICNFADDTALYACGKELDTISFKLEIETNRTMQWLKDNEMVANPSKFQLMFLSKYKSIEKNMSFDGKTIKSSDTVELLGITLEKILILNDIYKIFVAKQIIKPKLFDV